jgi:hypothetical protein
MQVNVRELSWKASAALEWFLLRTLPGNLVRLAVLKAVSGLAPEASRAGFVEEKERTRGIIAERWNVWKAITRDGLSLFWIWLLVAVGVGMGVVMALAFVAAFLGHGRYPNALEIVGAFAIARYLVRSAVARMDRRERELKAWLLEGRQEERGQAA